MTDMATSAPHRRHPTTTDAELVRRHVAGIDDRAFAELVERHQALVWGVCQRMLSDRQDVEDAFQAVFLVLARNAGKIKKRSSLASWLFGVATRVARRAARRRYRRRETSLEQPIVQDDCPLENVTRRHEQRAVDEELQKLPSALRQPIVLQFLAGKSGPDIARDMGLSVSAVEGRLKRGRKELRRRLAQRGIGPAVLIGALAAARPSMAAGPSPALVEQVVSNGVTFARSGGGEGLASELAKEEVIRMAIVGKKIALACGICVVVAGLGAAGLVPHLRGQDSGSSDRDTSITLQTVADQLQVSASLGPERTTTGSDISTLRGSSAGVQRAREAVGELEQRLEMTIEFVDLTGGTLEHLAARISEHLDVPVIIERSALDDYGLSADIELPLTPTLNGLTARSAMRLMLKELELTYIIEDEVIKITTHERAEQNLDVRVYALADFGGGSVLPDEVIELIEMVIAPDSWSAVGGPGNITALNQNLVISQTQDVHEKINDLIGQLNQAAGPATGAR